MGVYWPRDRGAAIERLRGKQDIEDERMKKRLAFFLLALLLAVSAWAAAEGDSLHGNGLQDHDHTREEIHVGFQAGQRGTG